MPTFADFFAGIGLVRIALEREGWRAVWANDINPVKFKMYSDFFGPDHYLLDDIRNVRAESIPSVDLAHASFPCVDLSFAGKRAGLNGKESGLIWEFFRILHEMRKDGRLPRLVSIENVVGWLTSGGGRDFYAVIKGLGTLGYRCDAILLDAAWFVPQSRPRIYVVAHLGPHPAMEGSPMDARPSRLRPPRLLEFMRRHPELSWGLLTLPEPPVLQTRLEDLLEDLPDDDPAWWPEERVAHLLDQMKPEHREAVLGAVRGRSVSAMTVYRRMRGGKSMAEVRSDGIAGCLRTPRGGSSRQILLIAGGGRLRVRLMTAREYARLQGVPEDYPIAVNYNQALWGFGDGVCVPCMAWLAKHALNTLVGWPSAVRVAAE